MDASTDRWMSARRDVDDDDVGADGPSEVVGPPKPPAAARASKKTAVASVSKKTAEATVRGADRSACPPSPRQRVATLKDDGVEAPLVDLGPLEEGVLVCRPSRRNRSPYVGDVLITSGPHAGSTAVTHLPNLDAGGKCRPGVRLLCRRQPGITSTTVGKFGTPKCELVCQLLRCDEPENAAMGGVWVSAHPSIGEKLVAALIRRGAFDDRLTAPVEAPGTSSHGVPDSDSGDDLAPASPTPKSPTALQSQVTVRRRVGTSASGGYRPDFRVMHRDGSSTVLETKQVVDTDYDPFTAAVTARAQAPHPVYAPGGAVDASDADDGECASRALVKASDAHRYERAGIFPWGKRGQKGPEGEAVVSARAIEHLRELSHIARTVNVTAPAEHAAVVLMAGRHDVHSIRPNGAACPSFAAHLATARAAGVKVLGHKCRWGEGRDLGRAFDAGPVPVIDPLAPGDELAFPRTIHTQVGAEEPASAAKKAKTKAREAKTKATPKDDRNEDGVGRRATGKATDLGASRASRATSRGKGRAAVVLSDAQDAEALETETGDAKAPGAKRARRRR